MDGESVYAVISDTTNTSINSLVLHFVARVILLKIPLLFHVKFLGLLLLKGTILVSMKDISGRAIGTSSHSLNKTFRWPSASVSTIFV